MRLIDADALRVNLLWCWCKDQSGSYDSFWDDVIERLDAQPTVALPKEHEHKTGYWENGHCTCCGEDIASKLDTWTNVQTFSFCPKCGAEMEVKRDD